MPRYVILRHETPVDYPRPVHWDLMLEDGDVLKTWALAQQPIAEQAIEAEQLADHRKDYLEFEGPLSGGRGTVTRWTCGSYSLVRDSGEEIAVRLETGRIVGGLLLKRSDGQRWIVTFSNASIAAVCSTPDEPDDPSTPFTSPDK